MFVKISDNNWINLYTCREIEIHEASESNYKIIFCPSIIRPGGEFAPHIGPYETETEAREVLDMIWKAFESNHRVWEPEPESTLTVQINGKWAKGDRAIDVFINAITDIGITKVEELELIVNKILLISTYKDPSRAQRQYKEYYIVSGTNTDRKKKILDKINSKLDDIEIEAKTYRNR